MKKRIVVAMLMGMMVMGSMGILHTTEVQAAEVEERTHEATCAYTYYEEDEVDQDGSLHLKDSIKSVENYETPKTEGTGVYDVNNITAEDNNETIDASAGGYLVDLTTTDENASLGGLNVTNKSLTHVVTGASTNATIQNVTVDGSSTLVLHGNDAVNSITGSIYNDGIIEVRDFDLLTYANLVDYLQNALGVTLSGNGFYSTYSPDLTTTYVTPYNSVTTVHRFVVDTDLPNTENGETYENAIRFDLNYHNIDLSCDRNSAYAKWYNYLICTDGTTAEAHVRGGGKVIDNSATISRLLAMTDTVEAVNNVVVDPYVIYTTVLVKDGYTQAQIDELTNSAIAMQQAEAQAAALQQYYTEVAIPQALNFYDYYESIGLKPVVCCGTLTAQQIADMYHISVEDLLMMNGLATFGMDANSYIPAYMVIIVG